MSGQIVGFAVDAAVGAAGEHETVIQQVVERSHISGQLRRLQPAVGIQQRCGNLATSGWSYGRICQPSGPPGTVIRLQLSEVAPVAERSHCAALASTIGGRAPATAALIAHPDLGER